MLSVASGGPPSGVALGGHRGSENPAMGPGLGGEIQDLGAEDGRGPSGWRSHRSVPGSWSVFLVHQSSQVLTGRDLSLSSLIRSCKPKPLSASTHLRGQGLRPGAHLNPDTWVFPPPVYSRTRGTEKSGYQPEATELVGAQSCTASHLPFGSMKQQQKGCGPLICF